MTFANLLELTVRGWLQLKVIFCIILINIELLRDCYYKCIFKTLDISFCRWFIRKMKLNFHKNNNIGITCQKPNSDHGLTSLETILVWMFILTSGYIKFEKISDKVLMKIKKANGLRERYNRNLIMRVPCLRFLWITNSSDHRRVWTANLLHTK